MSHTLLLADDSVTIQRVIELTFADEDVNVVAVSDGDEAIAVMDRTPPDIVLADVGMPGRNGYEVAEHIRDTPRLAHIPIVLLTGAFEPIDQAKAAAAGCDGVLAKPFEPQLVIGRVRELLSKPKQAASPDATLPPTPAPAVSWTPSLPEVPQGATPNPGEVGDYFERLDQAFASLSAHPADASIPSTSFPPGATALDWFASPPPPEETGSFEAAATEVIESAPSSRRPDRWNAQPSAPAAPPDLPYAYASAPPPPALDSSHVNAPIPSPPPLPTLPPLADAFAALLAAEQASPSPIAAPVWPSPPQPPSPAPAVVTDEMIEEVVRRALDQLSDRVLREAVDEKVTTIAERLVREEIERIKASIK